MDFHTRLEALDFKHAKAESSLGVKKERIGSFIERIPFVESLLTSVREEAQMVLNQAQEATRLTNMAFTRDRKLQPTLIGGI